MTLESLNIAVAVPEMFLLAMACLVLVVDVYLPEENRNFSYDSDSEKLLDKLTATASNENYDFAAEIAQMETKIKNSKRDAVREYKEAIVDLIEKEMAGRYYYQKGKIKMRLKNDQEIEDAIKLLREEEEYKSLLKG